MKKKLIAVILALIPIALVGWMLYYAGGQDVAIINSKGEIANHQRNILIFTTLLSLMVVVPVLAMLAMFSWHFRETNKKATYSPNWDKNHKLEATWWGIPIVIIGILAVVTWNTSHSLDPWKPLESNKEPLNIQVVAMQWKWLFIYPEENIATVNYLKIPVDRPVNFQITADAPMNSFWIPSLGGQIYAMNGMTTKLHLIADEEGTYQGRSANISGEGFASMRFYVQAVSDNKLNQWIVDSRQASETLNQTSYDQLAIPSTLDDTKTYSSVSHNLYDNIIAKFMPDHAQAKHEEGEAGVHNH